MHCPSDARYIGDVGRASAKDDGMIREMESHVPWGFRAGFVDHRR